MKINLLKSTYLSYFVSGSGWLLFAVFSVFNNVVLNTLASVFFFVGVLAGIKLQKSSYEPEDEMSEHNLLKAKAATLDLLRHAVCIVLIFLMVFSVFSKFVSNINEIVEINIIFVLALIFSFIQFSVGVHFLRYEKDGE